MKLILLVLLCLSCENARIISIEDKENGKRMIEGPCQKEINFTENPNVVPSENSLVLLAKRSGVVGRERTKTKWNYRKLNKGNDKNQQKSRRKATAGGETKAGDFDNGGTDDREPTHIGPDEDNRWSMPDDRGNATNQQKPSPENLPILPFAKQILELKKTDDSSFLEGQSIKLAKYRNIHRFSTAKDCSSELGNEGVSMILCPTPKFKEPHDPSSWLCVRHDQVCNGDLDCPLGEDEDPTFCFFYKATKEMHLSHGHS